MCVTNLTQEQTDHVALMARFAMDAIEAAAGTLLDESAPERGHVRLRIGIHTGAVAPISLDPATQNIPLSVILFIGPRTWNVQARQDGFSALLTAQNC